MMVSLGVYVRRGRRFFRRWLLDPRLHTFLQSAAYFLGGFAMSAASLSNSCQPLALGLLCAASGWPAILLACGGAAGYLTFWGTAGAQGVVWCLLGLAVCLLLGGRELLQRTPLLLPALAALIVAAVGLLFQIWRQDTTSVAVYLLRIALAALSAALFARAARRRDPLIDWMVSAVGVLALAQILPYSYLGLGYIAAGILTCKGALPAAALAGLALDLARITPVPMTAVLCLAYLLRLLPWSGKGSNAALPRRCTCW